MLCSECKNKPICKVYETNDSYRETISISVDNCMYHVNKHDNKSISNNNAVEAKTAYDFSDSFDQEEYNKIVSKVEPVKEDKCIMTCSTCGGTDYAEYIGFCSKCGKEVCGNCATSDQGLSYCKECWEAI